MSLITGEKPETVLPNTSGMFSEERDLKKDLALISEDIEAITDFSIEVPVPQETPEHTADDMLSLNYIMVTAAVETDLDTGIDDSELVKAVSEWI